MPASLTVGKKHKVQCLFPRVLSTCNLELQCKDCHFRQASVAAEGVVELLESGEARRREASGDDWQRQQAASERAHKAAKASRDKKLGRKAAEDALQEDASGGFGIF